ncbi:hypothetical protein [Bauldia sp.]|uniref:hypothetical protein n=1 Tax=Bauldia sp. TaxID=2575872 RepID=UPI003BA8BFAA
MHPTHLSHPRAITPISDAIHDRFEITLFEREFIDSAYFQRLHFVLQNSTAYVAFPSNKNTRFPHSVGVAHVVGEMFGNALSNATYSDLDAFFKKCADFLEHIIAIIWPATKDHSYRHLIYQDLSAAHLSTISGLSKFLHTPIFPEKDNPRIHTERAYGSLGQFSATFIADTLWQALRFYGLMHDIGHLPMSHAFEAALDDIPNLMRAYKQDKTDIQHFDYLRSKRFREFSGFSSHKTIDEYSEFFSRIISCPSNALESSVFGKDFHEVRSISVFNRFISEYQSTFLENGIPDYAKLIHHLTLSFVLATAIQDESHRFYFLNSIHSLIDSEAVDADRLDYTLRDGNESGSHLGQFDLIRVYSNSVLINNKNPNKERNGNRFSFAYYIRAVSGIEQFFEQRYQIYKYIIYHRTSSRSNRCLEYLLSQILNYCFSYGSSGIRAALDEYSYIETDEMSQKITNLLPSEPECLIRLDDSNLRTLLFRVKHLAEERLRELEDEQELGGEVQPEYFVAAEIVNLCNIVVLREFQHVHNPFKRISFGQRAAEIIGVERSGDELQQFLSYALDNATGVLDYIRRSLYKKMKNGQIPSISVLINIQKPRCYINDEQQGKRLYHNRLFVVRENGAFDSIDNQSLFLKNMYHREGERKAEIYIVSENIKNNAALKSFITVRIDSIIRSLWRHWKGTANNGVQLADPTAEAVDAQPRQM